METIVVEIRHTFPVRSSRLNGREARARVLSLLETHQKITLDFTAVSLTPSFADELVGGLAANLGRAEFEKRVGFDGMTIDADALIRHVICRRLRAEMAAK